VEGRREWCDLLYNDRRGEGKGGCGEVGVLMAVNWRRVTSLNSSCEYCGFFNSLDGLVEDRSDTTSGFIIATAKIAVVPKTSSYR
jgi:hypothetical protein